MPPTASHLPEDPNHPNDDEDFSGNYQTPSAPPGSSQLNYSGAMTYGAPSSYYPGAPASYPQSMPSRVMAPAPGYSFGYTSAMPGSSASQLSEGPHPPQPYIGSYGGAPSLQRSDNYYYSQSSMPETSYVNQYMPFRQTQLGLPYAEAGQPPSPHPSTGSSTSQRPNSPDQRGNDPHSRRIDEVRYGSMANNYRHIITTVSQASPSPSTDSSGHSFERPIVDDMLHRAVEGLRHLDPSRAEQYSYPYDPAAEVPSGVVSDAPPETVFVQYYEDGRTDVNPTKKKRERKGTTQCASCHATSTPEWRRGPLGPRTLCNACGLVYAKLMKKRAKEEDGLSVDPPRRARSGGRSRQTTEESEEDRGADRGSDDALSSTAGPSRSTEPSYPP